MPLRGSSFRGFPLDEEEGGVWSSLASRHPDIAARLRQRPATWARKRRPSSQDATDDFGDSFEGFDRFPFDDIPPEFREHFPSHWNRRFSSREEPQPTSPQPQSPPQQTAATQTEDPGPSQDEHTSIPQYGLRNTVDLGHKSPADPSLVDGEDRSQRSASAPPDNRSDNHTRMSGQSPQEHHPPQQEHGSNVRHIPIFVEGRDEPVINKNVDNSFRETKPSYAPPPPQPHIDRDQYFTDDTPHGFHQPPNFSRSFGTPFNKGFRQGASQPFTQQKMYPQNAFARGASPQRSQSPKPQPHPEEHYVKVPVYHEQTASTPSRPQQKQPSPQKQTPPPAPEQQAPPQPHTPPQPKSEPTGNDPIKQILNIQTDVLNLMTDVENFNGSKKDKQYLYLDEMLTRNLIKLDNIETEGKENIRQARKEAIKCIEKCIAVLEAIAEKGNATQKQHDVEMQAQETEKHSEQEETVQNGDVEMKEPTTEEVKPAPQTEQAAPQPTEKIEESTSSDATQIDAQSKPQQTEQMNENIINKTELVEQPQSEAEIKTGSNKADSDNTTETQQLQVDTRTEDSKTEIETKEPKEKDKKTLKKSVKVTKKRDKSKDKKDTNENVTEKQSKDNVEGQSNKEGGNKVEPMQVDGKGEPQAMELDAAGGTSQ
ncbi:BAG domain-containing protein Samui isoform X2 [Leptidea sinapis]|uniref:BAG domain-containing protein Samui isoform X2 n=1 Tax=Leptidea sinapis TaxID=189913 RepID=UPI002121651E|nr:BAG domain-containing protein Samui isoform X2 [Leptidea sinapis]